MECVWAQTRPWFILSSERVLGNGVRTHVNSRNIPREANPWSRDAASRRTASQTHCQLSPYCWLQPLQKTPQKTNFPKLSLINCLSKNLCYQGILTQKKFFKNHLSYRRTRRMTWWRNALRDKLFEASSGSTLAGVGGEGLEFITLCHKERLLWEFSVSGNALATGSVALTDWK